MIGLAEAGKVKTVIVKDMSRIGRDYLKVATRYAALQDTITSLSLLKTPPVFLFFKKKTAALISQNRRQATVLCQGAWMTSRRNNGFFIIPCFAAYRFIARSYDYILAFLMHSRL